MLTVKTALNRAYIVFNSMPQKAHNAVHYIIDFTTQNSVSNTYMKMPNFFRKAPAILTTISMAVFILFSFDVAVAQNSYNSKSTMQDPTASKTKAQGYLRFEGMQYGTKLPENPELDNSLLASANLIVEYKSQRQHHVMDLTAGKYVDWGGSQFTVNQLYASVSTNEQRVQVSAGRKLEFWSQADQDWQLGLWQPKSLLDALRPEDQGLTGVFYKHNYNQYEFLAFASPIFIPTMGPSVREKDGSLVAQSRWYSAPSNTFSLNGTDTRVAYDLDVPDIERLVSNPGGGLRARWGAGTDGLWTSASAGYKPINALLLKYKKSLFLPETDPQTGEVTVSPEVGYHYIWGADVGYRFSSNMISFSYIEDSPDAKLTSDNWVVQNPQRLRAFTFHADSAFSVAGFEQPVGIALDVLHVDGSNIRDFDADGTEQGAIFGERLNFNRAASVKANFQTTIFNRPFFSNFKYMREFEQKGTLINAELNYYPQKSVAVILGADVLGVDDDSVENTDSRFLNQFRANDRVYGGMSYVF